MKNIISLIFIIFIFLISCNKNNQATSSISGIGDITINPYKLTPLSAVYRTSSINASPITVTVKGQHGEEDLIHTYPAGYGNEFEIHGLYPECNNTITVNDGGRIITKNEYVGSISYKGLSIPSKFEVKINNLEEEKYPNNPDMYFIISNEYGFVIATSRNGYTRYFIENVTGSKIVIDNKKIILYPGYNTVEYNNLDLLGKSVLYIKDDIHHDVIKVGNNYLFLSSSIYGVNDRLTIMDSYGNFTKELKFGPLIKNTLDFNMYPEDKDMVNKIVFGEDVNNINKDSSGSSISADWFHGNSLVYDPSTDILYVSSRTRGVLAIDYSEWKLIWWMADESINTAVVTTYSLIPYDNHFKDLKSLDYYRVKGDALNDGPKNQHALFLLPNGNLAMFDNQGDENSNSEGSRYVEYQITGEPGNWTAKKVSQYRDPSLYSRVTSDVDLVGENYNNILISYGYPTARILEVEKNLPQNILFRLDLPYYIYRSDKMPLYYDEGRVYSEDCNLKN
ncbi:aryl-sulfate sulfotransferase [Brachyspira intermedia]|uniref:aryl-sulfate sulfotransferase n=1 Tax=Brachyspira intermedia TaxID=84377 RepID=UPI00300641B5